MKIRKLAIWNLFLHQSCFFVDWMNRDRKMYIFSKVDDILENKNHYPYNLILPLTYSAAQDHPQLILDFWKEWPTCIRATYNCIFRCARLIAIIIGDLKVHTSLMSSVHVFIFDLRSLDALRTPHSTSCTCYFMVQRSQQAFYLVFIPALE